MVKGVLVLEGWGGQTRQVVEVVGATPKRYRMRALTRTRLAGRRHLEAGDTALVPKSAIRDNCTACHGARGGAPGNEMWIDGRLLCDYCHADGLRTTPGGEGGVMPSKVDQYEAARLEAERLYPPGLRLRSAFNTGVDYDAYVSVEREQRCGLRVQSREVTLTRESALELARWIIATFGDQPGGEG